MNLQYSLALLNNVSAIVEEDLFSYLETKIKVSLLTSTATPVFLDNNIPFSQVEQPSLNEKWLKGNFTVALALNEVSLVIENAQQLVDHVKNSSSLLFSEESEEYASIKTVAAVDQETENHKISLFKSIFNQRTGNKHA